MPSKNHPPALGTLKAGKAFANTPAGRAVVAELQAVANSPEWRALAAELETATKQGRRDWEAHYGEPYPASLGDWQRLLVRAGVDPNHVLKGSIELGDAVDIVRGYLERLRDTRAASLPPATLKGGAAREYPPEVYTFLQTVAANERGMHGITREALTATQALAWDMAVTEKLITVSAFHPAAPLEAILSPRGRGVLAAWRLAPAEATPPAPARRPQESWQAEALLILKAHPDWPNARIADAVGVNKSTLSRCELYQAAAAMARGEKPKPRDRRRRVKPINPHDIDD